MIDCLIEKVIRIVGANLNHVPVQHPETSECLCIRRVDFHNPLEGLCNLLQVLNRISIQRFVSPNVLRSRFLMQRGRVGLPQRLSFVVRLARSFLRPATGSL